MVGVPPCISYFWGCPSAGRVGNKFGAQTAGRHGGGYGRRHWIFFVVEFLCPWGHLGGHFGIFGCPDPHLDPKRAQGPENVRFHRFPARTSSPFGGAFGAPFRHIFFSGLRDTQKGGSWRAFKTRPVFLSIWGSARRASGGFPCTRELNFHFAAGPKKGSKMGAKMEPFGLPDPNYTNFGAPFVRN